MGDKTKSLPLLQCNNGRDLVCLLSSFLNLHRERTTAIGSLTAKIWSLATDSKIVPRSILTPGLTVVGFRPQPGKYRSSSSRLTPRSIGFEKQYRGTDLRSDHQLPLLATADLDCMGSHTTRQRGTYRSSANRPGRQSAGFGTTGPRWNHD
jgi:hypothetical protein